MVRELKQIGAAFLCTVMLLMSFAACTTEAPDANGDKDKEDDKEALGLDISGYTIVRPDKSSTNFSDFTAKFKNLVLDYTGAQLSVATDYIEEGEQIDVNAKEILLGETNRQESIDALKKLDKDNSFVIEVTENKIVILGKSEEGTIRAMKTFLMNHAKSSKKENTFYIYEGFSKTGKVNLDSIVFDNFTEFQVTMKSSVYEPPYSYFDGVYEYPTMIELRHNRSSNGIFLATCESGGDGYVLLRSTDKGKTWEEVTRVKDTLNKGYICTWMPYLYELPVDMGDLKAGTIILAATSRDRTGETFTVSTITLYISTDAGETWKTYCNVDTAKGLSWGVWEPVLIYDDKTERLYCYYSDDSDPEHDQKLVYKYTTDMKTWVGKDDKTGVENDPKECVACADPALRPGMIAITELGNGEYYMTYEMVGISGSPVYYKKTTDLDDWGDVADYGKPVKTPDGVTFGSAPWSAWTPAGGECGTIVVVGRHPVPYRNTTEGAKMLLSFDYGETYVAIDNPIPYEIKDGSRCGYSPFLYFSEDGETLYYMNNPLYGLGFCEKIVLAKIKIW